MGCNQLANLPILKIIGELCLHSTIPCFKLLILVYTWLTFLCLNVALLISCTINSISLADLFYGNFQLQLYTYVQNYVYLINSSANINVVLTS